MVNTANIVNGVDVDKVNELIDSIKADPDRGKVEFRSETRWINGAYSKTTVRDFIIECDEPPLLIGGNRAPNPVELVLAGLGSCLSVGFAYSAAAMGINIKSLDIAVKGNLDLRGFLGISDSVRPGYQWIEVRCRIDSDVPRERLEGLFSHVTRTSPVGDIMRNAEPVRIILED